MICQFKRLIYPKAVTAGDASYMIALYRPCEKVMDAAGNVVSEIKAVGYCLPTADNLRYDMRGRWSRSAKHGIQFEVEGFDEVIVPSKEGVIAYLCSGQIKGIGPKTAEKIYAMFGQNTLTVLDHEPEQLLAVSGISKTKLKKICDSYLASRGARDVVAFLAPHGVTPNRAVKLYKQYGEHTMDIVRNHPYRLCEMVGIGFKTADRIAVSMGFDPLSPERVDEGLIFTLTDAELKGHLCMEKHSFLKQCLKLLDTEGLTEEMLAVRASRMLESGRLASYDRQVYRAVTARTEQSLAWAVYRMLTYEKAGSHVNIDTEISAEEKKQGIQLASEQRHAVTTALTSQLSVITGGPGTGKTLIQRFLLDIYLANYLFRSVPHGSQLVLIGDADQLPSVGPGAVLSEIIACGAVPVVRLDRIFRQSYGSRIAANAKLIRHGNLSLEYGEDFQFYDSCDMSASAQQIETLYLQETARYGVDNVAASDPIPPKDGDGRECAERTASGKAQSAGREKAGGCIQKADIPFGRQGHADKKLRGHQQWRYRLYHIRHPR